MNNTEENQSIISKNSNLSDNFSAKKILMQNEFFNSIIEIFNYTKS